MYLYATAMLRIVMLDHNRWTIAAAWTNRLSHGVDAVFSWRLASERESSASASIGHVVSVNEGVVVTPYLRSGPIWLAGQEDGEYDGDERESAGTGSPSSGVFPNHSAGKVDLRNGVPLATMYHAAAVLLQSYNSSNRFGPSLFEGESAWQGRDWRFGKAGATSEGEFGLESIVRDMDFRTHETNGTNSASTRQWALRTCDSSRRYVNVVAGDPQFNAPLGAVRLEGWDLLRADSPARSVKAVVSHAANYRNITETNLRAAVWPIIDAATNGGNYTRWWLRFWLDWIGTSLEESYANQGVQLLRGASAPLPAVTQLDNTTSMSDTAFVEQNMNAIMKGDNFIHDMSNNGVRSPLYAAFVLRFAASWPREARSLPDAQDRVLLVDQVVVPGASHVGWLNGACGAISSGRWPTTVSTKQLLGLAHMFLDSTNSHSDCMRGLELAVSVAFADPYANVMPQRQKPYGDDPMVLNCGRGLQIPMCGDNSLPAYLAPYYSAQIGTHIANDLLSMRCGVLQQVLVYYHCALSQSHAVARMVASLTCDTIIAGVASEQLAALTRKEGLARHISKLDRLTANICAHLFGFIPYQSTLTGESLSGDALAITPSNGRPTVYAPLWTPQQWLGYEICEVLLMMPEGWALPGPGARFQSDTTKGAPVKDKYLSTKFVRMFRSLPVLDDYQWLGDGGQAHGAGHICAGHGSHYYVQSRGWWRKPYLSEAPTAPTYVPLLWVDKVGLPGVLVPGQFPVWDDHNETNMAWGLRINPIQASHELLGVLNREPNKTRYRVFTARNGFLADDPVRVTRLMPELRLYDVFKHGDEPGTPLAAVERLTPDGFDVAGDGQLVAEANSMSDFISGPTRAGSTPASGGRSQWRQVSSHGGRKRVGIRQRYVPSGSRAKSGVNANRFSALAGTVESHAGAAQRQQVAEDSAGEAHSTQAATQQVRPTVRSPIEAQAGPSDDELIKDAITAAQSEREQMQRAGVGSAPPLRSYADAVLTAKRGATDVDAVTRMRAQHPTTAVALPHEKPALVSREVDGKPVGLPTDYAAPPSSASEDMLAAISSGVLGRDKKKIEGRGN
jgi:hypothetical protein